MSIAILSLGTEIVRGELVNTNAQWLADAVSLEGFSVSELACVGDERARIIECLERLARSNDAIVCTGGLGPTTDDVTTEAVAELLHQPLELDRRSLERIAERFARLGRPMLVIPVVPAGLFRPRKAGGEFCRITSASCLAPL